MTFWKIVGIGAGLLVLLPSAALGVLMAAQRAKAWWVARGEDDEAPVEELSVEERWEAIETGLSNRRVVDRRFRALMRAQKVPLYRRIPGLRPRLGTGRRPS